MIKILLIALTSLLLSACGFTPLYGTGTLGTTDVKVADHLALVEIGNIPDREGQILRNHLIDRFYRDGRPSNPSYSLSVQRLEESLIDLDITKFSDSTRGQLRLNTQIILQGAGGGEILLERKLQAITSYNILASEFSTRVSEDNARQNAIKDLAQQIETQLSLYFNRQ